MITSFHEEMKGTVQYDGSSSDPFPVKSGVKQGCVLAPTLFGILFSLLLRYACSESEEGIYLHTRSDGSLFNVAHLRAKTKVRKVLVREMLFADDAAITAHTETALQELINCFARACSQFGLTISIKKTNILGQNVSTAPSISIGDCALDVVENFTYLGSNISSNLSLDTELNIRIGKASAAMARLTNRVWENTMLTIKTKTQVYQACVLRTLLYGSESWTLYTWQERRLTHSTCAASEGSSASPRRGPSKGRNSQYVRSANQETPTLARPCHPHARWQVTQRHFVRRACHWVPIHRKAYAPL